MDASPAELAELKNVFKAECDDHLTALDSLLLKLEQAPANALVLQETFRRVHSIKGAARMVGYAVLESVAHAMETMLAQARDGHTTLSGPLIAALFEGADTMGVLVRSDGGNAKSEQRVRNVLKRISSLGGVTSGAAAQAARPTSEAVVEAGPGSSDNVVRVSAAKVDSLLAYPGELMRELASFELELRELDSLYEAFFDAASSARSLADEQRREAALERLLSLVVARRERARKLMAQMTERNIRAGRVLEDLRHGVAGLGMLPIQTVLAGMPRLVRDTAVEQGKRAELQIVGAEIEIGKSVLDRLMEPLIHLVKNAIAHGIETPERRIARGKNAAGKVTITVTTGTASATISVQDDGEGIDLARIRETIVAEGHASASEVADLPESSLIGYLFKPGFSTATATDAISGRGVGLDIVAERVTQLRGTYRVENRPGQGLGFFLTVPVNLLWSSVLAVRAGAREACLRLSDIREAVILRPHEVVRLDGRLSATIRGETIPLLPLSLFGSGETQVTFGPDGEITTIVVEYGPRRGAFVVDGLIGVYDVIVRSLPKPFGQLPGIAGYSILPSGNPVCVLEGDYLVATAHDSTNVGSVRHIQAAAKRRLLVVEDSLTSRTLLRNIMTSAGYEVETAVDGADAWNKVQQRRFDCILSDIEMPNMNGWDFCTRVKRETALADIPFVLITSLSKDEERRRGLELGADAYMVKGVFNEQELLDTLERLVA